MLTKPRTVPAHDEELKTTRGSIEAGYLSLHARAGGEQGELDVRVGGVQESEDAGCGSGVRRDGIRPGPAVHVHEALVGQL